MACLCGHNVLCPEHPKCPWCSNESTVFASGHKQWSCTRCKKVFDKKTVVGSCTTLDHIYPAPQRGQKVRKCYCGKRSLRVNRNLDMPFYTAGETEMKKTTKIVAKKSAKKSSAVASTRESNLEYRFLKAMKDEPNPETAFGVVYQTMRKVKRGSLAEVTEAAVKNGFTKYSSQDPTRIVRVALRTFVNAGAVDSTRNGAEVKPKAKPAVAKKGAKKSFKLVKK